MERPQHRLRARSPLRPRPHRHALRPDGELCVIAEEVVGPTSNVTYSCEANPCAPRATTCDCALPLCEQTSAPLCTDATPRTVSCTNGAQ